MHELPERIRRLEVTLDNAKAADLVKESTYLLTYRRDDVTQFPVSLLTPPTQVTWQDGELFPAMDMNLPEGYLFQRILEMHPKRRLTKMHLLALMGTNGIGRIGYGLAGTPPSIHRPISKAELLDSTADGALFDRLVRSYLATGSGISGVQPKIMVPSRAATPIPDLIVKTSGPGFPHLAVNEFLCLSAARAADIAVPVFDLSRDGSLLVLDRFDVAADGTRLGFEDIAALKGERVTDRLSNRKYHGSYQQVAEIVRLFSGHPERDLPRFFEQLAFSVMVRNGDAHLKNFGMLYRTLDDAELSPLFDVVTTAVYQFERPGGVLAEDRTLALKWRSGKSFTSRAYPKKDELMDFGRRLCEVDHPDRVLERIAHGMSKTLRSARRDQRVPAEFLDRLRIQWSLGMQ